MSHGPEHHIEHAEHAAHASHDEFNKRVTISIAIVAAVLAAVTMFGHRAHNETLRLQGEALRLQSESGIEHSQAANRWAQFQAYNIRSHLYQALLEQGDVSPTQSKDAGWQKVHERWEKQIEKYEKEKMPDTKKRAEDHTDNGNQNLKRAESLLALSHAVHERTTRFDLGELGLQLGVVLCSLAILTKKRTFWLIGLLCSAAGLFVALTGVVGLFLGGGHH